MTTYHSSLSAFTYSSSSSSSSDGTSSKIVFMLVPTTHSIDLQLFLLSAGEDYTPTIEILTFTSAPSQVYVNISISSDAVVEQQETFGVRLSVTDQSVTLTQDEAIVTINDDTGKEVHTVTFKQTQTQNVIS